MLFFCGGGGGGVSNLAKFTQGIGPTHYMSAPLYNHVTLCANLHEVAVVESILSVWEGS